MKNIYVKIAVLTLCLLLSLFVFSCKESEDENAQRLEFSALSDEELDACATLGEYKGLEIKLDGRTKGEAVWSAVRSRAVLGEIPQQQIDYYLAQERGRYSYYAENAGMSYDEMLKELGVTESDIMKTAIEMTTDDIIFELVRRAEKIELTEKEKQEHFDKYVAKYVADYGYTEDYVKQNMADIVYSSMLYDKTTEYLITNNTFTE